jgi:hypothetical protein
MPPAAFIKGFDQLAPSLALAIIDLAQIQLPLDHLAIGATLALDDIPVAMLFAVFEASVASQEHDGNQRTPASINERVLRLLSGAKLRFLALWSIAPDKAKPAGDDRRA